MADASVSLDLNAKELYSELQNVTAKFVTFAQTTEQSGQHAGGGFFSALKAGLSKAQSFVHGVGHSIKHVLGSALGGLGLGLGIAGIEQAIEGVIKYGAHIQDLAVRTGVSAQVLSKWGNAAEKMGVDTELLAKTISFLEKTRAKATDQDTKAIAHYKELGVSLKELNDPMFRTSDLLDKLGKGSLDLNHFLAVAGRGAAAVAPLIAAVGDGAVKLGKGLSNADAKKLKELEDKFIELKQTITLAVGPVIIAVFENISDHLAIFSKNVSVAIVQLSALGKAAKTSNPVAAAHELLEGKRETQRIENDFAAKQKERIAAREKETKEENESSHPKGFRDFGTIAGGGGEGSDGDDAGGGKKTSDEREAEKDARDLARDKAELAEVEKQHHLDSLSAQERLAELRGAANKELDNANDAVRSELERVDAKLRYYDIVKQIERTEKEIARETKKATEDHPLNAQERDTADRRAHGSYTGPGGGANSGLVTGRVQTNSLIGNRSTADFHADFGKRVDLGPKHLDLNRHEQLKKSALDKPADKQNDAFQKAIDASSVLKAIEKNTNGLGKNK